MSVTIPIAKKETWIADALRLEKTTITKGFPSNVNPHYVTHVFPTIDFATYDFHELGINWYLQTAVLDS